MSDRSVGTGRRIARGRIRSTAAAVLLAVGVGFSIAAFAVNAAASSPARSMPQCRIAFQASRLHLNVGQDLVLTWSSVGADQLTASWTSGYIPFAGAVTTTMNTAGTFSYEVTGTINGQYCGSAGIEVVFGGDKPSGTTPPPASTASATSAGATGASSASSSSAVGAGRAGPKYPAQSPTGGSGVPWLQRPLNLLAVAGLTLLSSLILWKRREVRAPFVHRH